LKINGLFGQQQLLPLTEALRVIDEENFRRCYTIEFDFEKGFVKYAA
jgi:hypothetical protein